MEDGPGRLSPVPSPRKANVERVGGVASLLLFVKEGPCDLAALPKSESDGDRFGAAAGGGIPVATTPEFPGPVVTFAEEERRENGDGA